MALMWNWFSKKEKEALMLTQATGTMLPIPFATAAKETSIARLDKRIKRAEEAVFKEACELINKAIEKGYLHVYFDFYQPIYHVDEGLDINSIIAAGNDCIKHLETFGYSARLNGRYMEINWQRPKEITLNDIEWSI